MPLSRRAVPTSPMTHHPILATLSAYARARAWPGEHLEAPARGPVPHLGLHCCNRRRWNKSSYSGTAVGGGAQRVAFSRAAAVMGSVVPRDTSTNGDQDLWLPSRP